MKTRDENDKKFFFRGFIKNIERQFFNKDKICCDSEVSHKIQFLFCSAQKNGFCTITGTTTAAVWRKMKQNAERENERFVNQIKA